MLRVTGNRRIERRDRRTTVLEIILIRVFGSGGLELEEMSGSAERRGTYSAPDVPTNIII